jgi:hypothetical protein
LTLFFHVAGIREMSDPERENALLHDKIKLDADQRNQRGTPYIKALLTIDSVLDRLQKLVISTDDDNHCNND